MLYKLLILEPALEAIVSSVLHHALWAVQLSQFLDLWRHVLYHDLRLTFPDWITWVSLVWLQTVPDEISFSWAMWPADMLNWRNQMRLSLNLWVERLKAHRSFKSMLHGFSQTGLNFSWYSAIQNYVISGSQLELQLIALKVAPAPRSIFWTVNRRSLI